MQIESSKRVPSDGDREVCQKQPSSRIECGLYDCMCKLSTYYRVDWTINTPLLTGPTMRGKTLTAKYAAHMGSRLAFNSTGAVDSLIEDLTVNMDPFAIEFENLVNSFTNVEELMSFATFWNILDLPIVRMRLLQLRNPEYDDSFKMEQLDDVMNYSGGAQFQNVDDFVLVLEFVREQEALMQVNCFIFSQSLFLLFFKCFFFLILHKLVLFRVITLLKI